MKKLTAAFLALVMMLVFCVPASAETIQPFDLGAFSKNSSLTLSGTTAICVSEFRNNDTNISSVVVTQTLEKQRFLWQYDFYDGTWTTSSNGNSISFTNYSYNLPNGTYRVKSVFGVTSNTGVYKEYTDYSNPITIS